MEVERVQDHLQGLPSHHNPGMMSAPRETRLYKKVMSLLKHSIWSPPLKRKKRLEWSRGN